VQAFRHRLDTGVGEFQAIEQGGRQATLATAFQILVVFGFQVRPIGADGISDCP
jgi:hypothetical protein